MIKNMVDFHTDLRFCSADFPLLLLDGLGQGKIIDMSGKKESEQKTGSKYYKDYDKGQLLPDA